MIIEKFLDFLQTAATNTNTNKQFFVKPNTLVTPDDPEALQNMLQQRSKEKDTNKLRHEINELFQPEKPSPAKSLTSSKEQNNSSSANDRQTVTNKSESVETSTSSPSSPSSSLTSTGKPDVTSANSVNSGSQAVPSASAIPEAELKAILAHLPPNALQQQAAASNGPLSAANMLANNLPQQESSSFATSVVGNPTTLLQQQQQQQQAENPNSLPKEFAQLLANAGADNLLKSLESPDPRSMQPQQPAYSNNNNMIQSNMQGFNTQALTRQLYNNNAFASPDSSAYGNLHNNPAVEYIARALASTRYPGKRGSVLGYRKRVDDMNSDGGDFLSELKSLLHKYGNSVDGKKKQIVANGPIGEERGARHGAIKGGRFKIKLLNRKRSSIGAKNNKKKLMSKRHRLSPHYNTTETPRNERGSKRELPNW